MHSIPVKCDDFPEILITVEENTDDALSKHLRSGNYSSLDQPIWLEQFLATATTLIDVGANLGCFSLIFAKTNHPVIALEASPANTRLLEHSAVINDFKHLTVHNVAISDSSCVIDFCEAGATGFVLSDNSPNRNSIRVNAVAFDDWEEAAHISKRIFIKIDIEGHECIALKGMRQFLLERNLPPMLIESNGHCLNWFNSTPRELCSELEDLGYGIYRVDGKYIRPWNSDELQIRVVENLLCVKEPDDRIQMPDIRPPRSRMVLLNEITRAAMHTNPAQRIYLARTIEACPLLRDDDQVRKALSPLLSDEEPIVKEAIAWL